MKEFRRRNLLGWACAILGAPLLLAIPWLTALAYTTGGWWWFAATLPALFAGAGLLLAAFVLWLAGSISGWVGAANPPPVPPAPLPLRVRSGFHRTPVALILLMPPLLIAEWVVMAITVEAARLPAAAMVISEMSLLAWPLTAVLVLRVLQPQVIIEAEGVRLPAMRVALPWEEVAEIRAWDSRTVGLAILPRRPVRLPWWLRMAPKRSPWLTVPATMMAIAVETVVSTAIHARNSRLQVVGQVDRAGGAGTDA